MPIIFACRIDAAATLAYFYAAYFAATTLDADTRFSPLVHEQEYMYARRSAMLRVISLITLCSPPRRFACFRRHATPR